ncbi:MAG: hypothetical protein KA066_00245 [Candidatus Pacebacteria bacterium]|nr:hypothetical protein [Candidatus Paceibacterota bacterium]
MKNLSLYFFGALIVASSAMPLLALAQPDINSPGSNPAINASGGSGTFTLADPLGNKNFCQLVKSLLDIILAIGIPVAVLFLVWSGFKFILARGRPAELEVARKNFYYVIIGIAVFLGAWTLAGIISTTVQSLGAPGSIQFCGQ